jgi:hypothetical protein
MTCRTKAADPRRNHVPLERHDTESPLAERRSTGTSSRRVRGADVGDVHGRSAKSARQTPARGGPDAGA